MTTLALERIHGLLGSALIQAIPSDDQIIIEKIRQADEIALAGMRKCACPDPDARKCSQQRYGDPVEQLDGECECACHYEAEN